MGEGILRDVRVLDLSAGLAGSVAALVLAEAGAEVIRIRPPGEERDSACRAVWDRSKRDIRMDVGGADRADFERLAAASDVLIHDLTPAEASACGLGEAALASVAPQLIVCAIGGYPAGHRLENMPVDDMLVLAESGISDEQKAVRRDGPVYLRFPLGSWGAVWLAATGIVARLIARRRGGRPGRIETSLLQGALVPMAMHWYRAETPTEGLTRGLPKTQRPALFECRDGVWLHLMASPDKTPLMAVELGAMGPDGIAAANAASGIVHRLFPNWGANEIAFRRHDSATWLEQLWEHDVPGQAAVPMGQLYFDEQASANAYVVDVDDPGYGATRQPGPPFAITPPAAVRWPARKPDQDRDLLSSLAPRAPQAADGDAGTRPLAGIRVLDFGNFLAGPLAAMLMADLGAEVIKVEAPGGDQMRWVEGSFIGCQRGKRSLALDLKNPGTRPIVERLVAQADIVHHNLRMPAAEKLGLGYEALRAINPELIYSHVSSYGPLGPRRNWPGYDQLFQAQTGWEYEGAGEGNPPIWHRFGMIDHQCAMASLFATLLALYHRLDGGGGQSVAASLLGAGLLTVSETIVLPDGSLTPFDRLDGDQMGVSATHRLHRCTDGWIAAAGGDPAQAAVLAEATGAMDCAAATAALERIGAVVVPARERQCGDFFDDADHRRSGVTVSYDHPVYGRLEQPGAFWRFEGLDLALDAAPPTIGQHSNDILADLGFDAATIRAWCEQGIVKDAAFSGHSI